MFVNRVSIQCCSTVHWKDLLTVKWKMHKKWLSQRRERKSMHSYFRSKYYLPIMSPKRFIDLFCGIGGFHYTLKDLGYQCVFACDSDKDCRQISWGKPPFKTHGRCSRLQYLIMKFFAPVSLAKRSVRPRLSGLASFGNLGHLWSGSSCCGSGNLQ